MTNILLLLFFVLGLLYRVYGLWNNHPFWVDEFSTAAQAQLILKHGLDVFVNKDLIFDSHNITTHFLVALSFKLFGAHEFSARLPVAIIGAAVPILVFLVSRKLFGKAVAFSALLLTTFSYFEIVWSRQARSYMILQFFILLTTYLYFSILERKKPAIYYIGFTLSIIFGLLTHFFYYLFIVALLIHSIIFHRKKIQWQKVIPLTLILAGGIVLNAFPYVYQYFTTTYVVTNNVWYYHSFLWREYGLVTFLGVIGLVMGFLEQHKKMSLLLIHTVIHLAFILFFFPPYVSRYLLPIFPYLILGMSFALVQTANLLASHVKSFVPKRYKTLGNRGFISIALSLIILANGHKFVNKPKSFYSVNHDFREIALIDYKQVYDTIKQKGVLNKGKTAVIDTWDARLYWYLGNEYSARYVFRWQNENDRTNGLVKRTEFLYNAAGEKVIPTDRGEGFIGELNDLKKVLEKYPKGFIFIDDGTLPSDVREYAEKNFKKELYIDHYTLDDNPYSIWPATLYSWGV